MTKFASPSAAGGNQFAAPDSVTELPRDRYGRPLITPPEGGEPVAYTRVTTLAKSIENTYHLGRWSERMVALGMGKRRDLQLAASAISDPDDRGQKRTLQDIADRAKDSAAPSAASIGTAVHSYTERADRGEDLSGLPEEYVQDIAAYREVTRVFDVHSIETFVVNDDYQVGGTYDRIYIVREDTELPRTLAVVLMARYDTDTLTSRGLAVTEDGLGVYLPAGTHVVGDVKTGKSVDLGAGAFAIQLGTYANSLVYNHESGSRAPLPERLCPLVGVIVHVPAGKGTASLHWLDIDAGWSMAPLCVAVREWQSTRGLIHRAQSATASPVVAPVAAQIAAAGTLEELAAVYRRNRAAWTPGLNSLAGARKAAIMDGGTS